MLTPEQVAHFKALGFIILKDLFSPKEIVTISQSFDEVMEQDRKGEEFEGQKRHSAMAMVERHPALRTLIDDDRIHEPVQQLLGDDYMWFGSDGNLYVGDTHWHSDAQKPEIGLGRIKIGFYLDPVSENTGCLRVIAGSHRQPLHAKLKPLWLGRIIQTIEEGRNTDEALKPFIEMGLDPDIDPFSVGPSDIPSVALESTPGDILIFDHLIFHSSWGGKTGRRMFSMNYFSNPTTNVQIDLIREVYTGSLGISQVLSSSQRNTLHEDEIINSDRPRIQRMMARNLELGLL